MAFKIFTGIPKPPSSRIGIKGKRKYPFDDLEIGQAFFIPHRTRNTLSTHANDVGKELGRKFATRLVWLEETIDETTGEADYTYLEIRPGERPPSDAVRGIGVWRDPDPVPGEEGGATGEDEDENPLAPTDDGEDADAGAALAKPKNGKPKVGKPKTK